MIEIWLYDQNRSFLERMTVKYPERFILYRGRLFERELNNTYILRQYSEIY